MSRSRQCNDLFSYIRGGYIVRGYIIIYYYPGMNTNHSLLKQNKKTNKTITVCACTSVCDPRKTINKISAMSLACWNILEISQHQSPGFILFLKTILSTNEMFSIFPKKNAFVRCVSTEFCRNDTHYSCSLFFTNCKAHTIPHVHNPYYLRMHYVCRYKINKT